MTRLNLYVNGRLVRSETDTPEGRAALDKAALLAAETSDDVVVRKGVDSKRAEPRAGAVERLAQAPRKTGATWPAVQGGGAPDGGVGSASSPKPPKPTGNVCNSCVPVFSIGPSGKRLRHAWTCPDKAGQPISASEYAQGRQWHPAQGRR